MLFFYWFLLWGSWKMNARRTRRILSSKQPVMSCTLLHGILATAVRKGENTNRGLALGRAKHSLKNQKNAFGKKSKQEKYRHNKQCTCCNHINMKEKDRRVKHLTKWLNSKFLNILSPLFSPRGQEEGTAGYLTQPCSAHQAAQDSKSPISCGRVSTTAQFTVIVCKIN